MDICGGEGANDSTDKLAAPPLKQLARLVEEEAVFVAAAVGEVDMWEGAQRRLSGEVHELERSQVVGLCKLIVGRKLVEGASVDPYYDVRLRKEKVGELELPDVFISGHGPSAEHRSMVK